MTIERLPSGSYRLTEMYNGRRYRCTIDHRPSKIEAREIMQDKIVGFNNGSSFKRGAEEYIKSKINILSPSTVRGYQAILRNLDPDFKAIPLDEITLPVLQAYVNQISENHTPKTVRNVCGFIMAVLKFYGSEVRSPRLPQKEKMILKKKTNF